MRAVLYDILQEYPIDKIKHCAPSFDDSQILTKIKPQMRYDEFRATLLASEKEPVLLLSLGVSR